MENVIQIENLYKEYTLGTIGHGTLYRDLQSFWATKILNKEDPNTLIGNNNNLNSKEKILALNNINISVKKGEVLGIIGANGAGKSTLLKVLSRVTTPTKGTIKIKGKIASLLEVGTGFHPELTGKENIYLNGAINGMNKKEIYNKIDEIVDFAGIEKFVDTPVKRYSSGMEVRLGFAVAAYLNPDIMVVDEVLAVGDASFQKKATKKMEEVSTNQGRTVLFVSHNMDSIKNLCSRAIILGKGEVIQGGETSKIVNNYLTGSYDNFYKVEGKRKWDIKEALGNQIVRLVSICTKNITGDIKTNFDVTEEILIEFEYKVISNEHNIASAIEIISSNNNQVLITSIDDYSYKPWGKQPMKKKGYYISRCKIPGNLLGEGSLSINLRIFTPPFAANLSEQVKGLNILNFRTTDSMSNKGSRGSYPYPLGDVIRPKLEWITKEKNN